MRESRIEVGDIVRCSYIWGNTTGIVLKTVDSWNENTSEATVLFRYVDPDGAGFYRVIFPQPDLLVIEKNPLYP